MIRIYLDNSYLDGNELKTSVLLESEMLNISSISYHYDSDSSNVLSIAEGVDADRLTAFMMPPYPMNTLISDIPQEDVSKVIQELQDRNIITSGSVTVMDLVNNICKAFNVDFNGLGKIMNREFS
tara:strand:- start:1716 stop:2090 length:375 start_codon:yes stop_codon:yes gene_type:complete